MKQQHAPLMARKNKGRTPKRGEKSDRRIKVGGEEIGKHALDGSNSGAVNGSGEPGRVVSTVGQVAIDGVADGRRAAGHGVDHAVVCERLDLIGKLYRVEAQARQRPPDGMSTAEYSYQLRQEKSRALLVALQAWLLRHQSEVMPKSLIGKAISYALGQWVYLCRYIDDGRAPIDNNLIERDIRPFAVGRN